MPERNGMGPMNMGPMNGREMGCRKGYGRGCGSRQAITKEEEIEMLNQEKEAIDKRLEELK